MSRRKEYEQKILSKFPSLLGRVDVAIVFLKHVQPHHEEIETLRDAKCTVEYYLAELKNKAVGHKGYSEYARQDISELYGEVEETLKPLAFMIKDFIENGSIPYLPSE